MTISTANIDVDRAGMLFQFRSNLSAAANRKTCCCDNAQEYYLLKIVKTALKVDARLEKVQIFLIP